MTTTSEQNPTPSGTTRWHEASRKLVLQTRTAMDEHFPGYVILTTDERLRLSSIVSVPDEFLEQIALALEGSPSWAGDSKLRPDQIREVVALSQALLPAANDVEATVVRGLRDTVLARRAEICEEALRLYGVWRKVDRKRDRQSAVPHISRLKESLGRGRPTRRAAARKAKRPSSEEGGAA